MFFTSKHRISQEIKFGACLKANLDYYIFGMKNNLQSIKRSTNF